MPDDDDRRAYARRVIEAEINAAVIRRGVVDGWIPGETLALPLAGFDVWPSWTVWQGEPVDLSPEDLRAPDVGWWWFDTDEPEAAPIFVAGPVTEPPVPSDEILRLCTDGRG